MKLTYHFGLRPWEIDRLTLDEFEAYCRAVRELEKQAKKGAPGG